MSRLRQRWSRVALIGLATLSLVGCFQSELSGINARQLTAEEQGNLPMFVSFGKAAAYVLYWHDHYVAAATRATNSAVASGYYAKDRALMEQVRAEIRKARIPISPYVTIVPDSMNGLTAMFMNVRAIVLRVNAGGWASDDEIITALRGFRRAESEFRMITSSRPLAASGTSSPSWYLYVSLRNVPIVLEPTRGELYVGPTLPVGPFDVQGVVGPIGASGGTRLERLVIRDPASRRQRVFALNNRLPRMQVPASFIEQEGMDLVVTAKPTS